MLLSLVEFPYGQSLKPLKYNLDFTITNKIIL